MASTQSFTTVDLAWARKKFRPRTDTQVHKGSFGHGLLMAGSPGKMGAAVMAAGSALRSGIGLLTAVCAPPLQSVLHHHWPEAMCAAWPEVEQRLHSFSALAIGPGLGTDEASRTQLLKVFETPMPTVMDADALTIIAQNGWNGYLNKHHVITPHVKEFDRMFGPHQSLEQRLQTAARFAQMQGCTIVLKGAPTHIVTPKNRVYINTTGHQGLAKGGSGDVLTGLVLSMLAQGYRTATAACLAVYMHGLAAEYLLEHESYESMLPGQLPTQYGKVCKLLSTGK